MYIQSQIIVDRFIRRGKFAKQYLNAHEKLMLFILASYIGKKSVCYPSISSLANDCSLSIASIKRAIKSLEKKELLYVIRKSGCNNHYSFNLKLFEELSADSTKRSQLLDPDSSTNREQADLTLSADSTSNNDINNSTKYTSLQDVKDNTSSFKCSKEESVPAIQEIFKYWQTTMKYPRAKLDKKRRKRIKEALALYSKEELKSAIDGCANTPYNMGQNDRNQVYNDIELIFRDSTHIERFINNSQTNNNHSVNGSNRRQFLKGVI
ncbi:Uncharacterised protein [Legionella busanensis]|uniref:Helix-turn-helix domain-containing protein n=1 Tax=Legionella busanensis TaxID=190655 RepID=A0A378JQS1_9GAMM|nr:helix-turn-helix domain-containing protein [Legionella busanensis]STX50472.1 Uncharacterised protein [Legionella busanensis]